MSFKKIHFTILVILTCPSITFANLGISASAAAAKNSFSTQIGANYDHELSQSPLSISVGLNSGSYKSRATYVDEIGESTVTGSEFSGIFGIGLFEKFFIDFKSGMGNVNNSSVLISEFSISPRFKFDDFTIGFGLETQTYKQNKPYLIPVINRDLQPDLNYKKTTHSIRLGYQFTNSFGMGLSYSKMTYDKDMESALQLLSGPTLATNNGIDLLSQLNGLLQTVTEINFNYLMTEMVELEFSIGRTQDFYDPKTIAQDARVGMLVYQTAAFNWGLGLTSGRSEADSERSTSIDTILLYAF